MPRMSLEERIESSLKRSASNVFLRSDFNRFGGYDQVGRALRSVIKNGLLVKVGYGVYVKARPSTITGNPVPCIDLMTIGFETMKRLGIEADLGKAMRELRDGLSTQVPMAAVIDTGKSRVNRKITVGKRTIIYERDLPGRAR